VGKHDALIALNTKRWAAARLTRTAEFAPVARRLVAQKARYITVSVKTGVPWFVIAVTHQRESSQNWGRSLAQGDPWDQISTHVPKGRGPFDSWEAAAIDALVNCSPYAARWKDWSPGGTMTLLELYNGLGYFNKGLPSPYVWSGTDQYQRGKYVADGVFDPNHVDKQLGCAGLILAMQALDASINFKTPLPPIPDAPLPKPKPPAPKMVGMVGAIVAMLVGVAAFVKDHPYWTGLGVVLTIAAILYFINRKKP
jgi:lysozyme family protein